MSRRCLPSCRPLAIAGLAIAAVLAAPAIGVAPEGVAPPRPAAGPLPWPIDRTPAIVSTFGEYRYDHLHAGIDISTGGATGVPVRAVADGAIYRLKVEWRGYGRALYMKHDRGDASVYGHLESYEEKTLGLESRVRARRAKDGTPWPGDIFLDPPVRVRRGQVIAYTGESGVGPPHLHFELRGAHDDPIDPFRHGLQPPANREAPVLDAIVLTAATPATTIDGRRELSVALKRRGDAAEAGGPVAIDGPVLATLVAWDPIGGGRAGLASVAMALDGAPCFRTEIAGFRFEQYPIAGLVFDHRWSRMGPMRMGFRLGALPGNLFADGHCGTTGGQPGALDVEPGDHRLEITARDAAGREGRARLTLRRVDPVAAPAGATRAPVAVATPSELARPPEVAAPMQAASLRFHPRFFEATLPRDASLPDPQACGDAAAGLDWRPIAGEGLSALAIGYERGAALASAIAGGTAAPGCPLALLLDGAVIGYARPGEALRLESGTVRVELPANARFFPGPVVLRRSGAVETPPGLRLIEAPVDLLPAGEALNGRASLRFAIDPATGDARRLGIFRWDEGSRRWGHEGDERDPVAGTIGITFRRYGRFALLADESAPEILEVRPRPGAGGRRPAISARVREIGKGLNWDGVRFTLDGRDLPAEYDPDRGLARPFETPIVAAGTHRLTVVATDRAGNSSAPVVVEFSAR